MHDTNRPDGAFQTSQLFLKNLSLCVFVCHSLTQLFLTWILLDFSMRINYCRPNIFTINVELQRSNSNGLQDEKQNRKWIIRCHREDEKSLRYMCVFLHLLYHCKTLYFHLKWRLNESMTHFSTFSLYRLHKQLNIIYSLE